MAFLDELILCSAFDFSNTIDTSDNNALHYSYYSNPHIKYKFINLATRLFIRNGIRARILHIQINKYLSGYLELKSF